MIRTSVVGVVVLLATLSYGLPDKRAADYGAPSPSYGAPEPACYPKVVTNTKTKDIRATSLNYGTKYQKNPSTVYTSIIETVVSPKTVIIYSTMTAYAEPKIKTQQKVIYDTKMITTHNYHKVTKYGYQTQDQYFTETKGVYVTKTETQKYPLTNSQTKVNIKTNAYYVTQTQVQPEYQTITINNPYYVTKYQQVIKTEQQYHTKTETVHEYATNTVWVDVPEYHTVTKCPEKPTYGQPSYNQGAYARSDSPSKSASPAISAWKPVNGYKNRSP